VLDPERTLIGIAASSVLVAAACISGLPSTSCVALAETYGRTINYFGITALIRISGIFYLSFTNLRSRISEWFIILVTSLFFINSAFIGIDNLKISIKHCMVGTESEISSKRQERIPLYEFLGLQQWHSPVRW
jgi:hypothetical protein